MENPIGLKVFYFWWVKEYKKNESTKDSIGNVCYCGHVILLSSCLKIKMRENTSSFLISDRQFIIPIMIDLWL